MKFLMVFLAFSSLLIAFYLGLITKGYQKKIQKIPISNKGYRITKKIFYYSPYVVMFFLRNRTFGFIS
ncbi:hypothetical protein FEFB_05750 [Fructobacillus sp. EFB-N1]|nr:hypothetical protein FEFB_05750 [Fructobacillus sp. EFB-N1]